jgi:hypothetical protein
MQTLIERTIQIGGMGHPDTITVFNLTKPEQRNHLRFKSLETICNRKITVWFDTKDENDIVEKEQFIKLQIPSTGTEDEIKDFILKSIIKQLSYEK